MRILIQRVTQGSVTINATEKRSIRKGYVILLGVKEGDSQKDVESLAKKTVELRIMADEAGKMNASILDVAGDILVVSQFTLYADTSGGRRPSFIRSAKPDIAKPLYELFIRKLKDNGITNVQTGEFGAYMTVEIINDGPVTILLDSVYTLEKRKIRESFSVLPE